MTQLRDTKSDKASSSSLHVAPAFMIVFTIVFICFLPDLKNGLLDWDDAGYILENTAIQSFSFKTIGWAFTSFCCNYWAPLTWLSLAVDYAVWGLNPVGYHLTNNILHALNSGLYFLISYNLLKRYHTEGTGPGIIGTGHMIACSLLAALFFGIHPMRVESVAWATERKDVLSVFFGLGALLAYLNYTKDNAYQASLGRYRWYWVMLVLYLLSLLSKAMLITLPFVLLVLDWYPLRRLNRNTIRRLLAEKIPLLALAVPASLITMQAMAVSGKTLAEINVMTRVLTAFKSIALYLRLLLVPVDISPVYFHPVSVTLNLEYAVAIILVMTISIWSSVIAGRRPVYLAAWLIFLITLFPVLGLTQNGPQELAPRFTYFPAMALSLLAAIGIMSLLARISGSRVKSVLAYIAACSLLTGYALLTVRDIGFWRDDVALWSRVIELQPHRFGRPYSQRATILSRQGDYSRALADVSEALLIAERKRYQAVHEIYAQRARIFRNMKEYDRSSADFRKAIELSGEPNRTMYAAELEALGEQMGERRR